MLQGVGSWEGRVWRKALLLFPAAPANVHTILAVSLVITIHLCVLIISRNLGSGEVAWAYPQGPGGL